MNVEVIKDVVFATIDGDDLALDIYKPDRGDPVPVVLFFHGGAWRFGDKAASADVRLKALASFGIAVVSANYRFVNQATYPAQLHDAKAAVRWVRANGASYGLKTESIAVWGASAGALLSSLVALTSSDSTLEGTVGGNLEVSSAVQAAVHWFGPIDLVSNARPSQLEGMLLPPPFEPPLFGVTNIEDVKDSARDASPLYKITSGAPPFLVAHGDRDRLIDPSESRAFHDALSRAGVESTFILLGGAGHEGEQFDSSANLAVTAAFLLAHIG